MERSQQVLRTRALPYENEMEVSIRQVGVCGEAIWRLLVATRHHGRPHAVELRAHAPPLGRGRLGSQWGVFVARKGSEVREVLTGSAHHAADTTYGVGGGGGGWSGGMGGVGVWGLGYGFG